MMETDWDNEFHSLLNEVLEIPSGSLHSSSSDMTSSSSSSASVSSIDSFQPKMAISTKKTNPRKSRNPVFMPSLRILKRDIRRRYSEMYINSVNSHDPTLFAKFLTQFCIPNVQFEKKQSINMDSCPGESVPPLIGVDQIVTVIGSIFLYSPDLVFRLKSTTVTLREGETGATISSGITFKATRIYESNFPPQHPSPSLNMNFNPSELKLTENPTEVHMDGVFTIKVDNMNRITSIQMHCKSFVEKLVRLP